MVQVFSCEFREIFQSTYFYRTPLVAASVYCRIVFFFHLLYRCPTVSFRLQGKPHSSDVNRYFFVVDFLPGSHWKPRDEIRSLKQVKFVSIIENTNQLCSFLMDTQLNLNFHKTSRASYGRILIILISLSSLAS